MYSKLKELRYRKRYTTKDMALWLGISKPFYCQLENQTRRLSYEMAVKIARIFKMKPDQVFYQNFIDNENQMPQETEEN